MKSHNSKIRNQRKVPNPRKMPYRIVIYNIKMESIKVRILE